MMPTNYNDFLKKNHFDQFRFFMKNTESRNLF